MDKNVRRNRRQEVNPAKLNVDVSVETMLEQTSCGWEARQEDPGATRLPCLTDFPGRL